MAFILSCVFRSLDTETIFMALVICWVLLTPLIRSRISLIFAKDCASFPDYLKGFQECLDRPAQLLNGFLRQFLTGHDLGIQFRIFLMDIGNQFRLEPGDIRDLDSIGVAVACGMAGIISGVVTMTALGSTLINVIVPLAQKNILFALFLTMLACIVLGMGVPTTANYVIMATITAPILIEMGIPMLAAHMFVFYFGIVADITPPVALAAYAGAAIAKCNPMKAGLNATKLAITAFIIPYIFALNPKMLLVIGDPTVMDIVLIIISSFAGILGVSAGMEGYLLKKLAIWQRIVIVAAGLMLIYPGWVTDLIGILVIAALGLMQYIQKKSEEHHHAKA